MVHAKEGDVSGLTISSLEVELIIMLTLLYHILRDEAKASSRLFVQL